MSWLTLESDSIFLDRPDCDVWDCSLAVDENWGHINFFPFNGRLKTRQLTDTCEPRKSTDLDSVVDGFDALANFWSDTWILLSLCYRY